MDQTYGAAFARLYDVRFAGFARQVAPRIAGLYERTPPGRDRQPVLDLCCGTGQLALHFLERGFRVVGLDLSPHMLAVAEARARPFVDDGRARFVVGDASAFALPEPVGLVTSTYDGLNHLPSLDALRGSFASAARALVPDGLLVFDLNTRRGLLERWTRTEVQEDDAAIVVLRAGYDGGTRAVVQVTGFVRRQDGAYDRFDERIYNTVFALDDVRIALAEAGFASVYVAGADDPAAPVADPEGEGRVFVVARRAG